MKIGLKILIFVLISFYITPNGRVVDKTTALPYKIKTYSNVVKETDSAFKSILLTQYQNKQDKWIESWKSRMKEYEIYEVTAYTAGFQSTGKTPSHPLYGITASGEKVKPKYTLACPPSIEFGTEFYIPYFDHTYTCVDRGSAITQGHLDVYMQSENEAMKFGRQLLRVKILGSG